MDNVPPGRRAQHRPGRLWKRVRFFSLSNRASLFPAGNLSAVSRMVHAAVGRAFCIPAPDML